MPAQYKDSEVQLVVPKGDLEERISWSSEKVSQFMLALDEGYKPKGGTPFYEGNPDLRKGNILFDYTAHEIEEIKKCASDICYFADNYCTVMTDEGLRTIVLRDYQHEMLNHFQDNRFSICLASRQIGKTICSSIYIAWYVLFNYDKNALILSNKGATTREIIDKAKVILDNLPFFLKPGVVKNDVFNMKFDNGCRIIGQSTTKKAAIGFTIHLLFMDEFAHIHSSFLDIFYENVYPTISSSKISRVIITSTPNGFNKFYDLYTTSINGKNEYAPFRVDWWQVPGRDDAWMKREVANLGTEEAFNRQYGNQFIASSNLLLGPSTIKRLQAGEKAFVHHEFYELDDIDTNYSSLVWHPEFDIDRTREDGEYWVLSVDIAEGNGGDYSVINIFSIDVIPTEDFKNIKNPGTFIDFFGLKQIGVFRSNEHTIEEFSKILYVLGFNIFDPENVKMVIEWNMFGSELIRRMETIFPAKNDFDEEMIVKFKHRADAKQLKFGLKLKRDNKSIFCQNFKKYVSQNRITVEHKHTITECISFGKTPTGSYEGMLGNDDLAMSCVNVSEFFHTVDFSDFVEEKYDLVDKSIQNVIDELLARDKDDGNLFYDIYDLV
jgi:hypothetical protein